MNRSYSIGIVAAVLGTLVLLFMFVGNHNEKIVYIEKPKPASDLAPTDTLLPTQAPTSPSLVATPTFPPSSMGTDDSIALRMCDFATPVLPDNLRNNLTIPARMTSFPSCIEIAKRLLAIKPPTDVAPAKFPENMTADYTLNGEIPIVYMHFINVYNGNTAMVPLWTIESVNEMRKKAMEKNTGFGNYPGPDLGGIMDILDRWGQDILWNKEGIVVGSELPWAEALLLEYGASRIITIEYGKISCQHPQITTTHPNTVYKQIISGVWKPVEWAFSFSSLEHAGLGRYGDPLDPNGDFETVKLISCLIKPGGYFILGLPMGNDTLVFNGHRIYGRKRLAKLWEGWDLIDFTARRGINLDTKVGEAWNQPTMLMQNQRGCDYDRR